MLRCLCFFNRNIQNTALKYPSVSVCIDLQKMQTMSQFEEVEIKHKDGSLAYKCWKGQGLIMPLVLKDPQKRLNEIKELEYKDGDIIVVTYPKVGTTWMCDSVGMLLKGKSEISGITGTHLEFQFSLQEYIEQDTRRLAMTHLLPVYLSESQKAKSKFILGIRNPKDAAVSMYYHVKKLNFMLLQGTWDQFFDLFVEKKVMFGGFFDYYRDLQKFLKSNAERVLVVYYEDMHKDYPKELRRMADFLGLTRTDNVIEQIAEKGRLKTMQDERMKDPKYQAIAKMLTTDGSLLFYRKGKVGDWKNHFTVTQNEIFDQIIEKEMKGLIFKFDYTL